MFEPRGGLRRIEQRAFACLEVCRQKSGYDVIPLPVPIEQWIEGPLGIRFGVGDLSYIGLNVLGGAFVREREIVVSERALSHEGRFRFTCAHELGHIILHRKVQSVFHDLAYADPFETMKYEREANLFAAAFLMPMPLLEREVFRICDDLKLDLQTCLVELMLVATESEDLWRLHFLPEISRRFSVSLTAALIRCSDLCLQSSDERPFLPSAVAKRIQDRAALERPNVAAKLVDGKPEASRAVRQGILFD
jgi:Zn-dependent peptidase ImmA (M78 family)